MPLAFNRSPARSRRRYEANRGLGRQPSRVLSMQRAVPTRGQGRLGPSLARPPRAEAAACLIREPGAGPVALEKHLAQLLARVAAALQRRRSAGRRLTLTLYLTGGRRLVRSARLARPERAPERLATVARATLRTLLRQLEADEATAGDTRRAPCAGRNADPLPEPGAPDAKTAWRQLLAQACEAATLPPGGRREVWAMLLVVDRRRMAAPSEARGAARAA